MNFCCRSSPFFALCFFSVVFIIAILSFKYRWTFMFYSWYGVGSFVLHASALDIKCKTVRSRIRDIVAQKFRPLTLRVSKINFSSRVPIGWVVIYCVVSMQTIFLLIYYVDAYRRLDLFFDKNREARMEKFTNDTRNNEHWSGRRHCYALNVKWLFNSMNWIIEPFQQNGAFVEIQCAFVSLCLLVANRITNNFDAFWMRKRCSY